MIVGNREALDEGLQPLARVDALLVGLVARLAGGDQVLGRDLRPGLAGGGRLGLALDAGGVELLLRDLTDVAVLVVEDLELEASGPGDDLPDAVEGLFGRAGHLDDEVTLGLPTDHRGLSEAHGVDTVADRPHRLLDRGLPQLLQAILPHGEVHGEPVGARAP